MKDTIGPKDELGLKVRERRTAGSFQLHCKDTIGPTEPDEVRERRTRRGSLRKIPLDQKRAMRSKIAPVRSALPWT
jgi:hypothetical protein